MDNYHSRRLRRKSATGLPDGWPDLFGWAEARPNVDPPPIPECFGAKMLARNFGFSPHVARVRAEHAGFNLEACE